MRNCSRYQSSHTDAKRNGGGKERPAEKDRWQGGTPQ